MKPTSEKKWSELDHEGNRHFFRLGDERAQRYANFAMSAWGELVKYLFAANTGAGAGIFLLLNSNHDRALLAPFFFFIAGAFFVGVSYFSYAFALHETAKGWAQDFDALGRDEITFGQLDAKNRARAKTWKVRLSIWSVVLSFIFLIVGGVVAVKPFLSHQGEQTTELRIRR